jgi:signal transduction histidine kinase
MKSKLEQVQKGIFSFLERHFILVAAVLIYGYYLLTSIDLIKHSEAKKGLLGYVLQFDSVILMWVIAFVVIQLQRYKKLQREEDEYRKRLAFEYERQRIHLQVLDEVTSLLQDNVNNPLAIISITANSIRQKFESDEEILAWLDRIDASLHRIHSTINDIKAYQTHKIVTAPIEVSKSSNSPGRESMAAVG